MTIYATYEDGSTRLVDAWSGETPLGLVLDPGPLVDLRTIEGFNGFTRTPQIPVAGVAALALAELQRLGEPSRNQDIAEAIGYPPPTVHRALSKLAKQGRIGRVGVLWAPPERPATEPTPEAIRAALDGMDEPPRVAELAELLGCRVRYLRDLPTKSGVMVGTDNLVYRVYEH